ncbi:SusC/RagA family TonB-linked outer membrane protein [Porphyromonas cangingivalis]|uniref:TonB-linked outer membrane protein, SusC/RagA family n=1 Tax=Porphyromonas cangingivalis TaxID=36874 RepID=A0A1T4NDC1_PORCN|nr:SusC/RagA family TonB-linked outer membrane protein [Porphyromonas cangingivalis]SJZ77262.1 TonB-linked outer membrane protein, SusC/RagA family [Porphyromonas cangingivalis]SPY36103.1 Outer membrane receptor for ferrienterochelin and colicins [Porphyromonas cangingivalis]VEJ04767.1 Outer membrane receptor for ferrienterochelin and colicins [Porphyromonas cangingivalis]
MKRITLLFAFLVMSMGMALAQSQVEVSGTVISAEDNQPIIGATVRGKTSKKGDRTNIDGKFKFTVPANEKIIIISFVGMKTREVAVGKNLKIVLQPDATSLDEVVAIAYGTAKKQSLVGAQSNVSAKQLERRPVSNVTNALAAAAPGVQVTTSSGQPGSGAKIMIRGFGSMKEESSAPLFVVDGAIYNGNISDLPASDIQSLSILKDASSTALYGSSAGNGVVLITTKSGSRATKGKPNFTFTTSVGGSRRGEDRYEIVNAMQHYPLRWQQWFNQYKYEEKRSDEEAAYKANNDVYTDLVYNPYKGISSYVAYDEAQKKWIKTNDANIAGASPLFVMPDGTLNPEVTGLLWGDDTDWEKELFRTGLRQEYTLSGGLNTEKMKSFMSLSYLGEDGYKKFTHLNRLSARINVSYDVNNWFTVGTNTSVVHTDTESPKTLRGAASNPFSFMNFVAPIYPIHQHDENGAYILDGNGNKKEDYSSFRPYSKNFNPVLEQKLDKRYGSRDAITNRTFAELKLYDGLKFRTNLGYDISRYTSKQRYNNVMGDQPQGMLTIENERQSTITLNQLLEYDKTFDKHHINILAGHESYQYLVQALTGRKDQMYLLGMDEMSNLSNMNDITSYTDNYRKEGYFSRISYDYGNLYNASFSFRRDGTSRFAPQSRWGNFWSVGAGWQLSNHEFMSGTRSWLDYFKLRASIGQTGNDAVGTYYAYQTLFSLGSNNNKDLGLRVSNLGNLDLRWEKQTAFDLAFEFGLFNRLTGTIELFNKESDDLLFSFSLPISTGVGSIDKNLGKVRNYGLEMDFRLQLLNAKDFSWDLKFNGTVLKNVIVRLPEENRKDGIEKDFHKYMENVSRYEFYLNEYIGVDPIDGKAIYRIDAEKYPEQANPDNKAFVGMEKEGERATWTKDGRFVKKHFCGNSIPAIYGGIGTEATYKGLEFAILFSYQLGGKAYDRSYQSLMGRSLQNGNAAHIDMLNAWKTPGDKDQMPSKSDIPRLDASSTVYDNLSSDRFLISASALMLRNVSLSYNLPEAWVKPLSVSSARVGIVGENLFMLSHRKGLNPMTGFGGVSETSAFGYAKTITANLTINF